MEHVGLHTCVRRGEATAPYHRPSRAGWPSPPLGDIPNTRPQPLIYEKGCRFAMVSARHHDPKEGHRPFSSNSLNTRTKLRANCCGFAASIDRACSHVQNSPDSSSSRLIRGGSLVTTLYTQTNSQPVSSHASNLKCLRNCPAGIVSPSSSCSSRRAQRS